MPEDDKKRALYQNLVDRVLNGEGRAAVEQRARAFANGGLPPPLNALVEKVAMRAVQIDDADFVAVKESGYSEDQIFELVICAAVGQSTRLYDAGLAALAEATDHAGDAGPDHAP